MIKLIVSDLDGTLMQKDHTVRLEDQEALRKAFESGIIITFASGRMYPEIRHIMKLIGLDVHAVSQNGAYVHTSDKNLIRHDSFETELIRQLAVAAKETPFFTVMCSPDTYVVTSHSAENEKVQQNLLAPLIVMPNALEALGGELMCCKISYLGDIEQLLTFKQHLLSVHGDKIDAYISDVNCLDVMPRHISKGAGLKALQAQLGILPEETICIGDSFNDVSMFQSTPHSFAMSSSHSDIKAQAAYVVDRVADAVDWALKQAVN
ncbi:Cof-type HAD-IIB family hydrolase [Paenibacillus sp. LMG 31456]|uniref:Cof-type HAD-IIB family hydrolase n=1 Tax=Paenibacillus foliorum TaxID=2654974 RepID=A0A972GR74_9BACL|nr:HAD family hydrolase [Paenibacillus foliorum]NOU92327.1 Cof-type HAD-IIB family hydrolase [Paenibacillus foliorum]